MTTTIATETTYKAVMDDDGITVIQSVPAGISGPFASATWAQVSAAFDSWAGVEMNSANSEAAIEAWLTLHSFQRTGDWKPFVGFRLFVEAPVEIV